MGDSSVAGNKHRSSRMLDFLTDLVLLVPCTNLLFLGPFSIFWRRHPRRGRPENAFLSFTQFEIELAIATVCTFKHSCELQYTYGFIIIDTLHFDFDSKFTIIKEELLSTLCIRIDYTYMYQYQNRLWPVLENGESSELKFALEHGRLALAFGTTLKCHAMPCHDDESKSVETAQKQKSKEI